MGWIVRLNQAIQYLEDNLEEKIDYDQAGRIACCSAYHFQRMFSYIAGVTLSEYIRCRRMAKAAFELQNSDISVIELAAKYGYESPTAFNRAFKGIHGVAPSVARKKGVLLNSYPKLTFAITVKGDAKMQYQMADKQEMRIVGIRKRLEMEMEQNFKLAPAFWQETEAAGIIPQLCSLQDQSPVGLLGVTVYENPNELYYYIAVATDKPVPEGMYEYQIPAASWVIFDCEGTIPQVIQEVFRHFCTEWLPQSGYEYAGLPDIEVYPPQEGKVTKAEVWIAVKKPK